MPAPRAVGAGGTAERTARRAPERVAPGVDESSVRRLNALRPASSKEQSRKVEAEEDRLLIVRAKSGDRGAFRTLVERHQRRAFAIANSLVRDERDAEEIVQEAFLRVYRGLAGFEGTSSFFTWLYRIVMNLSIDLIRRPSRREVDALDPAELDVFADSQSLPRASNSDPEEALRRGEIRKRLEQALDALPSYHRGVILMREVEGMSYEEMAVAMQVSKGTIMSRLFHARKKLQRALGECYGEQIGPVPSVEAEGADAR